jgi:hypothetical protein
LFVDQGKRQVISAFRQELAMKAREESWKTLKPTQKEKMMAGRKQKERGGL